MVNGLDIFRDYFAGFEEQYVLIGGTACDILFESNDTAFRATKDLDMVLIASALTPEFGSRLWGFINEGGYRNKVTSQGRPQFYRFDKPENKDYPKMLELFARTEVKLHEFNGLTPVHIDDDISSLSAILLNEHYYRILIEGKTTIQGLSVLRPEYLILFKAKAYLDLSEKKRQGLQVKDDDIRKHKNDILRITAELMLDNVGMLPETIKNDITQFVSLLDEKPFDSNSLKRYGLVTDDVSSRLKEIFALQ